MFVRRTLGCACDGMLDPRGAARPSTESPGGCYVTARHDVATVGESLTGLSERSARHVLVGRGIVKSLKRSGCAAVSRTHKTKSLCDRSGLQTALLVTLTALGVTLTVPSLAQAEQGKCPNEEFRAGPSARLPDCRAYELVTPEELGRTQAITFTDADVAGPSVDGEHLVLQSFAPLEPDPNRTGTRAVFSRTPRGWTAKSMVSPEVAGQEFNVGTGTSLSPDLSMVGFLAEHALNAEERKSALHTVEVGPVGGPYALAADISPASDTYVLGANVGTTSVPAFSDVLFQSADHQILPPGPERVIAEEAELGSFSYDLYDWTEGRLRLVNLEGEGAHVKRLNACGNGVLGAGNLDSGSGAVGAVSADGSKIFFTSCGRVYMRLDSRETVEVSAPAPGVTVNPAEQMEAQFNVASADGSEVVFNTATPLLAGETAEGNKLFIYNTVTRQLKLIIVSNGLPATKGTGASQVLISEDGSAVYYELGGRLYRDETQTGKTSFIAATFPSGESSYVTPNGQFFVFLSNEGPGANHGIEIAGPNSGPEVEEPRGAGHVELYRYDAADGSVMCTSCGEGVAPAEGETIYPFGSTLTPEDGVPPFVQMSDDGQRVFFQTTAHLVPQDTNSTDSEGINSPGMDVYEWEADGVEEEPGVVCRLAVGCTHLLSTGEDVGKATFLGASEDGRNVFFATAGQLVPQATPEISEHLRCAHRRRIRAAADRG